MTANDPYTRPSAGSAALVLIDMQRDFVDMPGGDAAMSVEGTYVAIPPMGRWRRPSGSGGFRLWMQSGCTGPMGRTSTWCGADR
jgi:nicotinamidase-related amidase